MSFSGVGSAAECHLQLLEHHVYSVEIFALIRLSCRCVSDVLLLHCACCTRLFELEPFYVQWASISLCQSSTYRAAAAAHPLEFGVLMCRTSQFTRCFLPAHTREWNNLPFTVFELGLKAQSIVGCFREFVFKFSVIQVLVGLQKQFINIIVFSTWARADGFNNNNESLFSRMNEIKKKGRGAKGYRFWLS